MIRYLPILLVPSFVLCSLHGSVKEKPESVQTLADLEWSRRVILVFPSGEASATLERLKAAEAGIEDRRISWFVFAPEAVLTNETSPLAEGFRESVEKRFPRESTDRVVLIGLDGTVKVRDGSLDLEALFARIDRMPMRRQELRGRDDQESR